MKIEEVSKKTQGEHVEIIRNLRKSKDNMLARWMINRAFYENSHFTMGELDKQGNVVKISGKKPYREIPLATDQIDGMRNMLLANKPEPYIYPDDKIVSQAEMDDDKFRQMVDAEINVWGKAIEYLLEEEIKLKTILKTLTKNTLLYSTSYIQTYHDGDKYCMDAYDVFDISIYPTIKKIDDYPYLVKHIAKPLKSLKLSKRYKDIDFDKLKERLTENKYFSDEMKNSLYAGKFGYADPETVIIDELYALEDAGLAVYSYIHDELIDAQAPTETKLKKMPFSMFLSGEEPYEMAMIEKFIPLNKTLDVLITKLERRVKRLDGGRLAIQSSEPIKIVKTSDGEFIRYKRTAPTQLPEENYPSTLINLIGIIQQLFSSLGVNAAVSSAGIPKGVEAWRAIESLKQSDYGKMENITQNLGECLTDATEKLVELVSVTEVTPRNIVIPKTNQRISIVGSAGKNLAGEGTLVFNANKRLKVSIESGLTHTPEAKRELVIQLVGAQLLPRELAVEMLKIGNTREIMDKLNQDLVAGKSIVDAPDFQVLPKKLQMAIVQFLQGGADPAVKAAIDGDSFGGEQGA